MHTRRAIFFPTIFLLAAATLLLVGCNADEQNAQDAVTYYYQGNYPQAQTLLDPLAKKTNGDFVLNNARLGSTALVQYRLDDAQDAFLRAYEVINSVGVNNGGRSLGATLVSEDIKVWKGEPFERAMVNFYLGLIYYMQHDYDNARAAFENALFKLKDYQDNDNPDKYSQTESNFALAYIMLGKSWQRLGEQDQANAMFAKAIKLRPDLASLANADYNAKANLLLVVEFGQGPLKVTNFDGSIVGFGPKPNEAGPIYPPQVNVDGRWVDVSGLTVPPVDLLVLAQDRRWQSIDTIRAVKSAAGTGLMVAGAVVGSQDNRNSGELGLGLFAAGLLLKATSQADVRQWEMLPRTVFLIPLQVSPGKHDVTILIAGGWRQTWRGLVAPAKGDDTYYFRATPWSSGEQTWPPPALRATNAPPQPGS
jgi:tetratricopeptide (TPR) repeat protein